MSLKPAASVDERDTLLARYRAMAEEGSDIIFLLEGDRIVFATSALGRLLKRTTAEFQDGRYLSLVHPDDMSEALAVRGTPPPGEIRSATYRVRHADGHYLWFETRTRGIYDERTGAFLREIAVGRDVTEQKETELRILAAHERAEAANRAKSAFLANMSHELRTPLNAIMGFAEAMQSELFGPLGDKRYCEYTAAIRDAGERLLGMLGNILDIAKTESGTLSVTPELCDLNIIVADVGGLVSGDSSRKGIALERRLEVNQIFADPAAIRKIVFNLLSNAIRFTPDGGRVCVESVLQDNEWMLRVRDSGTGISAEQLAHLSLPFEQLCSEAALARKGPGAGVGLALVRALTEAHGGRMEIESQPGNGTLVSLRFPRGT